jgi:hypothetical protein
MEKMDSCPITAEIQTDCTGIPELVKNMIALERTR